MNERPNEIWTEERCQPCNGWGKIRTDDFFDGDNWHPQYQYCCRCTYGKINTLWRISANGYYVSVDGFRKSKDPIHLTKYGYEKE